MAEAALGGVNGASFTGLLESAATTLLEDVEPAVTSRPDTRCSCCCCGGGNAGKPFRAERPAEVEGARSSMTVLSDFTRSAFASALTTPSLASGKVSHAGHATMGGGTSRGRAAPAPRGCCSSEAGAVDARADLDEREGASPAALGASAEGWGGAPGSTVGFGTPGGLTSAAAP